MAQPSLLDAFTDEELLNRLELVEWDRAALITEKPEFWREGVKLAEYQEGLLRGKLAYRRSLSKNYRGPLPKAHRIGKERFDRAKRAVPISTYLFEQGVALPTVQEGRRFTLSCPLGLHDDPTPSFTVYPNDAGWYCFGCHQGGSVIDLAMLMTKTNDVREALASVEELMTAKERAAFTVQR